MANWLKSKNADQFRISIATYKTENYFAEYEITVKCLNNIEWKTYRRYSEFDKLNDELIKVNDKFKVHFPPKKSFNNMSANFLNNRRKALEMYLNELTSLCHQSLPRSLAYFLEMDKYEIHGITTAAAKTLFTYGNSLLKKNNTFEISVLLIHAINQRMSSPVPTNLYQKQDEDFGNVLDVVESLKKVKIIPNSVILTSPDHGVGTSTIKVTTLTFDLSIFANVTDLQMNSVEICNLRGLYKMNCSIERLQVQFCLKSIEDLLLADFAYKESSIEHLQKLDGPLRCTSTVDFSHNSIAEIDISIVTLRQVQILNLSHNQLSDIQHMHFLTFLTELDLSYNNLHMSESLSFSNKLGGIKKLLLRGNKLTSLNIVDRMFSLEFLDVSENLVTEVASLLALCRLSCLENLVIKDNPICSLPEFTVLIFDIFLDRYKQVLINGYMFADIPLYIQTQFLEHRLAIRTRMLSEGSCNLSSADFVIDQQTMSGKRKGRLLSVDVVIDESTMEVLGAETVLAIPDVFNMFVYWFFVATEKYLNPKKLLWVTEVFAPNRSVRPLQALLVTSGTHNPNMLKCRLHKSFDSSTKRHIITIHPKSFVDLSADFQHMILGADKSFLRLDLTKESRDLYLCNNASSTDAFICHLYHVDDGMASFGDSRIVYLNEEDRLEMMRRFIDVWRLDMSATLKKNSEHIEIQMDTESELLFISRAMLQMKNGFQILLTVVVTQDFIYLVDERIYDWPDFNKHPNLSDISSGTSCSPYTSSCGHFHFLRTNAYFLCQIEVCTEMSSSVDHGSIIERMCPVFRYPVQVTFNPSHQSVKDPLKLIFETSQKSSLFCKVVTQQSTIKVQSITPPSSASSVVESTTPKTPLLDLPCHLRHLLSSYSEIRLSLSLSFPKLYHLAQFSAPDILSYLQDLLPFLSEDKIFGLVWSKFLKISFEGNDNSTLEGKEQPGLICISSLGVFVVYEEEEERDPGEDCYSDPEVDQPDCSLVNSSKVQTACFRMRDVFKVYVGLNHQWLTICTRSTSGGSETQRLVLMIRNKTLCKHIVGWINVIISDQSKEDCGTHCLAIVECSHHDSDIKELLFEIQRMSAPGDIDLVHYCSLDDVRFDPSMPCQSLKRNCDAAFSNAVVITTANIVLIRHNVAEYPIREFAPGSIRQSPRHLQYQVMTVIPLFDCLQLQLPGHDRSVLILVIQCASASVRYSSSIKVQLSISCQKEQKRFIDKLRHQWSKFLQIDTPLRVSVC